MRSGNKIVLAALMLAPLAACGMADAKSNHHPRARLAADPAPGHAPDALPPAPAAPEEPRRPALSTMIDERVVVGDPYMIDGTRYTPAPALKLDEVGYAAVLPEAADGRRTASGEAYVPSAITAAHRTLPLPSYVEVTSIDTGRTILVRVNDRGPLLNDRIIALSPGAARQLGLTVRDGTAAVRVRKVNPLEQERARLRNGASASERIETPPGLRSALARQLPRKPAPLTGPVETWRAAILAVDPLPAAAPAATPPPAEAGEPIRKVVPVQHGGRPRQMPPVTAPAPRPVVPPVPKPAPVAPSKPVTTQKGGYVVQVAALSNRARADALAKSVGGYVTPAGKLFRVRAGPFETEAAARATLGKIRAKGYADARLMANDAR